MKSMIYNGNTDPGRQRKENQDTFGCRQLWDSDKALLLVADGVGGYAGGEKAAAIAKSSIEKYMQTPKGDLLTMLKEAVTYANNQIQEERRNQPQFFEMCCVLTAVVVDVKESVLHFVHVGDTRLYRFRNEVLQKLTRDHSFVGIREDAGEISEKEAMTHPQRNQILREVGSGFHRIDDADWMDAGTRDFIHGDQLLICSDGLTDMLTSSQIIPVLSSELTQKEKVRQLINFANDMGGYDNITVVLLLNQFTEIRGNSTNLQKNEPAEKTAESGKEIHPVFNRKTIKRIVLRSILLLLFFAGTSWYFFTLKPRVENGTFISADGMAQTLPHKELKLRDSLKETLLHSAKSANPATPGPVKPMETDTIIVNRSKSFADLQRIVDSSGKMIVLIPAKHNMSFPALEISTPTDSTDTIVIRNIHFRDFRNAILINTSVAIILKNTTFENIQNPITYSKQSGPRTNKTLLITNSD